MPRLSRVPALILAAALLGGCSAAHLVTLKGDGSGTVALHLEVSKLLHDYIAGLAEVSGSSKARGDAIFDLAAIRAGFEAQPGMTVQKVSSPDPRSLDIEASFASLSDLFARKEGLPGADVISLTQAGGVETLKIHLDRENYRQVAALFPMLESPVLQSLGPQVDQRVTQDDYLEMIRFSLGDDGPALVRKSWISIAIRPEGEIVSQAGGTVSDGSVTYRIPLLRVLLLDTPLDFSLSFRQSN